MPSNNVRWNNTQNIHYEELVQVYALPVVPQKLSLATTLAVRNFGLVWRGDIRCTICNFCKSYRQMHNPIYSPLFFILKYSENAFVCLVNQHVGTEVRFHRIPSMWAYELAYWYKCSNCKWYHKRSDEGRRARIFPNLKKCNLCNGYCGNSRHVCRQTRSDYFIKISFTAPHGAIHLSQFSPQ